MPLFPFLPTNLRGIQGQRTLLGAVGCFRGAADMGGLQFFCTSVDHPEVVFRFLKDWHERTPQRLAQKDDVLPTVCPPV